MNLESASQIFKRIVQPAHKVAILQADNPDGDSLGSALALEHILGDMGKEPYLYCGVDIPSYLRHLPGWDRVSNELPALFDLSIIVDTSSISLFETLTTSSHINRLRNRPCLVIDHHAVTPSIPFASEVINLPAVATGEIIYEIADRLTLPLNSTAQELIATAILSDSLGLTSEATTARSIHIIGELVEAGLSVAKLENNRRQMMRKQLALVRYKGELLQRIELHAEGRIATITIPWPEIEKYSHAYNPSMLVIDEMRLIENVAVAIAYKTYPDGKVTAKIRSNFGYGICAELASAFGGGGHPYASGFKVVSGMPYDKVKSNSVAKAIELLDKLKGSDQ